jgi:hypothetical protein
MVRTVLQYTGDQSKELAMTEFDLNQEAAEQICQAFVWKDQRFNLGECVALLDGKVVAVTKDLESAVHALRAMDSSPERGMVFEVMPPVLDVIR